MAADSLRDKLAKNTAAAPATRAAATFVGTAAASAAAAGGDARKNQRTTIYLSPDLRRRLKIAAANADRTMNEITVEALEAWLTAHGG